jgi:hypothetical protein
MSSRPGSSPRSPNAHPIHVPTDASALLSRAIASFGPACRMRFEELEDDAVTAEAEAEERKRNGLGEAAREGSCLEGLKKLARRFGRLGERWQGVEAALADAMALANRIAASGTVGQPGGAVGVTGAVRSSPTPTPAIARRGNRRRRDAAGQGMLWGMAG